MIVSCLTPLRLSTFKFNTHATPESVMMCVCGGWARCCWMHVAIQYQRNYAWVEMMEVGPGIWCPTPINGLTQVTSTRWRIGMGGKGIWLIKVMIAWLLLAERPLLTVWQSLPCWQSERYQLDSEVCVGASGQLGVDSWHMRCLGSAVLQQCCLAYPRVLTSFNRLNVIEKTTCLILEWVMLFTSSFLQLSGGTWTAGLCLLVYSHVFTLSGPPPPPKLLR